jgi:hypothetical protein
MSCVRIHRCYIFFSQIFEYIYNLHHILCKRNVLLGKCPSGQMSFRANVFWANVFLGKCLSGQMSSGQMSFWANVFLGKCPSGQMSSGQMSFWANVFLGKCRLGKCPSGQMSYGQMSYGQMSLGKCLWANVVWANVMEPNKVPFDLDQVWALLLDNFISISCYPLVRVANFRMRIMTTTAIERRTVAHSLF